MKKILLTLFLAFFISSINAQSYIDVLKLQYQHYPFVKPENSIDDNKIAMNKFYGKLFIPIEFKNKDALIFNISHETMQFRNNKFDFHDEFYSTYGNIGYQKQWNDKWKTLFMGISMYKTTITGEVDKDGFLGAGLILVSYKMKENLTLKAGWYHGMEHFGQFFFPLAGINWKVNDRLQVYGTIPTKAGVEYKVNSKLYANLKFNNNTTSYNYDNECFLIDCNPLNNIRYQEGNLNVGLDYYIKEKSVFFAEVGSILYQNIDYNYEFGESFSTNRQNLNNRFMATIGFAYRVRLDKDNK